MREKSSSSRLKRIGKFAAILAGLYAATFVGNLGIIFFCNIAGGRIGDAVGGGSLGWYVGPNLLWRHLGSDQGIAPLVATIVWQITGVVLSALISWQVAKVTKKGWKVFVPVYAALMVIYGWVAILLGMNVLEGLFSGPSF